MKKSNLIKLFLILLMGVMVVMYCTSVYAADNSFTDITGSLTNGTNTNRANSNSNVDSANTNVSNTNTNRTNTNSTNRNNTNTGTIYNNNNLPQTGIEDSIPVAVLVVVFGISAVYAYKKIKEYRNI